MSSIELLPTADRLSEDLVAEVLAMTPEAGPNQTDWPGLTTYRFDRPQPSQWNEVHSLALCGVIRGRKRFVVEGDEHLCDSAQYLLFTRGMRFETEILEASEDEPYLSFVLQIDPTLVSSVLVDMAEQRPTPVGHAAGRPRAAATRVSPFDHDLGEAVLRFLRSLAADADRRVLAPMHLRELTYRLMKVGQVSLLLDAATSERDGDPVGEVTRYIREHLAEPLTVADMAAHVMMSPSALTARFVEATGIGPYQFAKRMRLNHARTLLIRDELTVSQVAGEVGYSGLSYFINEFKRQFATTPGAYARAQRQAIAMLVDEATDRAA